MKTVLHSLLLASVVALTAAGQDRAPGARPQGDRPQGDRPAAGDRMRDRPEGERPAMMRPQGAVDRIMGGGDIEGGMLLRLLDNPRIAEEIKLTEDQRTAIKDALKDLDAQLEALRPKLEEAIKVQTELLRELKPEEEKLMAAVEDAWKLRTEVAKIQTKKLLVLRSLLTGEQVGRAREMMDNFRERMGGFRGRGDNAGGGERGPRPEGDRGPRREGDRGPRPEGDRNNP